MNAPKVNTMVQSHLVEHGQLLYDAFIQDFVKVVVKIVQFSLSNNKNPSTDTTSSNILFNFQAKELHDKIPEFIQSCLPYLKSTWPEIRGNAAVIIGLLHNLHSELQQHTTESVSEKIANLLKDDQISVRVKAANALGLMFGETLS